MDKKRKGKWVALLGGAIVLVVVGLIVSLYRREIRTWLLLLTRFERLPDNEQGYPEYRHKETGIIFVRVPGGSFFMGTAEEDKDKVIAEYVRLYGKDRRKKAEQVAAAESPQHEVTLRPFLIAKYEVSQTQWRHVMRSGRSRFEGPNLPVDNLSWNDCRDFCERTGLVIATEAQWEYACRAGSTTAFAFGETLSTNQANYNGVADTPPGVFRRKTVPVDSFEPNTFGIHNMHGNVYEWCRDVYREDYYLTPTARGTDPECSSGSSNRVVRGGSWSFPGQAVCRSAMRTNSDPSKTVRDAGFRPVFEL